MHLLLRIHIAITPRFNWAGKQEHMHYNGPIDIALHPRNHINASMPRKCSVVFLPSTPSGVVISTNRKQAWAWGGKRPSGCTGEAWLSLLISQGWLVPCTGSLSRLGCNVNRMPSNNSLIVHVHTGDIDTYSLSFPSSPPDALHSEQYNSRLIRWPPPHISRAHKY